MDILYLLIPLSVAIVALAAWVFLRMSVGGQFDDLDSPAVRVLLDDDRPGDAAAVCGIARKGGPTAIDDVYAGRCHRPRVQKYP